jgi:hypothetical protein
LRLWESKVFDRYGFSLPLHPSMDRRLKRLQAIGASRAGEERKRPPRFRNGGCDHPLRDYYVGTDSNHALVVFFSPYAGARLPVIDVRMMR